MSAKSAVPLLLLSLPLPTQEPGDVLARFVLDGRPATVTRTDVALEMAFHLQRRDRGQQACSMLVDATLTRQAAVERKVVLTDAEVRAFWEELKGQLRAAGQRPEDFPAFRNSSMQQWLDYLALQPTQERLVRKDLGLRDDEAVSPDMLRLWMQEERKKRNVVTDPDSLPVGTCARVGNVDLPLVDVGFLLLRTSEDDERDKFVRQVVYLRAIDAVAAKEGVKIDDADLDAAVAERRADAARDPRYQGITFKQILEAEGLTVDALRQLRVFRAQVLLDKLAERLFPDAELTAEIERDRQAVLDLVGPRRRLGVVFVRALDEPNEIVRLTFDEAKKQLEGVRTRLEVEDFATVARIESEDPATRPQGGDAGWHRRASERLPAPVLAAAWTLEAGAVSPPVRTDEGWWLVKVSEIDPAPGDAQLVERLRSFRAQEFGRQLLEHADIEMVPAAPKSER
jgi:hypothetical protein